MSGTVKFDGSLAKNANAIDGSALLSSVHFITPYEKAKEDGMLNWVNYMVIVKGQTVQKMVKENMKDGACNIQGGFTVKNENAGPMDLTMKRLSACLLYLNSKKRGDATSNPPPGWSPTTLKYTPEKSETKFVPSMANLIPWAALDSAVKDVTVKRVLLDEVKYMCGAGLNFCWRMYIKDHPEEVDSSAVAFALAAFFLDLGAYNNARRKRGEAPQKSSEAVKYMGDSGVGTLASLLTNAQALPAPQNIVGSSKMAIFKDVVGQDLMTVVGGGSTKRLKDFLNTYAGTSYDI